MSHATEKIFLRAAPYVFTNGVKIYTSPYTVVTSVVLRTKTKCCFVSELDLTWTFSSSVIRNIIFMCNSKPTTPFLVLDVTIFVVLGGRRTKCFIEFGPGLDALDLTRLCLHMLTYLYLAD